MQPGIVSIIHTGYGSFASAKEAINRGAFAYVEKIGAEEGLMLHVHRAARAWTAAELQALQVRHTRELEDRVRRRTEELAEANAILQYPRLTFTALVLCKRGRYANRGC